MEDKNDTISFTTGGNKKAQYNNLLKKFMKRYAPFFSFKYYTMTFTVDASNDFAIKLEKLIKLSKRIKQNLKIVRAFSL